MCFREPAKKKAPYKSKGKRKNRPPPKQQVSDSPSDHANVCSEDGDTAEAVPTLVPGLSHHPIFRLALEISFLHHLCLLLPLDLLKKGLLGRTPVLLFKSTIRWYFSFKTIQCCEMSRFQITKTYKKLWDE